MIEPTEAGDGPDGARTRRAPSPRADLADALVDAIRDKGDAMHAIARHAVGVDDAADVVQQTLMRLVARPDAFDPRRGTLGNFLIVLTHGVAVDHLRQASRRRARERRSGFLAGHEPRDESDAIVERLGRARIDAALAALNADDRHLIVHAFFGGMSYRQIATSTGLPEGTVKSRIRRALLRLRVLLDDTREAETGQRDPSRSATMS